MNVESEGAPEEQDNGSKKEEDEPPSTDTELDSNGRPKRSEEAKKRRGYEPSFQGKTYTQLFQMLREDGMIDVKEMYKRCVNVIFAQVTSNEEETNAPGGTGGPQMSAKKGFEIYGQRAVAVMFKECKQLNDKSSLEMLFQILLPTNRRGVL